VEDLSLEAMDTLWEQAIKTGKYYLILLDKEELAFLENKRTKVAAGQDK